MDELSVVFNRSYKYDCVDRSIGGIYT